jgi:hypothetical protein
LGPWRCENGRAGGNGVEIRVEGMCLFACKVDGNNRHLCCNIFKSRSVQTGGR